MVLVYQSQRLNLNVFIPTSSNDETDPLSPSHFAASECFAMHTQAKVATYVAMKQSY